MDELQTIQSIALGSGGLTIAALIAVVWQHREIQRLRNRQEAQLDRQTAMLEAYLRDGTITAENALRIVTMPTDKAG